MPETEKKPRSEMTDQEKRRDAQVNPLKPGVAPTKESIVAQAYEHEDPTPTQEENDAAKLAAIGTGDQPPPVDPGAPIDQTRNRSVEAEKPGGYPTRSTKAE